MNRDKQMAKDAENKQAQARENYSKNKQILSEYKVKEKLNHYDHVDINNDLDKQDEEK